MQKGFSLVELLLVSLFGSLLLLTTSHALALLIKQQTHQSELLRLTEQSYLAEVALKNTINKAQIVLEAGEATSDYPKKTERSTELKSSSVKFKQFASSDWLVVNLDNNKTLFHLDKKTYGYGLAFQNVSNEKSRSDTLVNQVELMRLRFYCEKEQAWIKGNQVTDESKIAGVQFALLITSSQPIIKTASKSLVLWNEKLVPPTDGHYRRLVSATVRLGDKQ